jgi:alpha-L-fucosidase 2
MNHRNHHLPPGFIVRGLFAIAVLGCSAVPSGAAEPNQRDLVLWYRQPAQQWLEAMPIGNGMIGVMVSRRNGSR